MQIRSPSGTSSPGTGSVDLPTGRLSPVRAASSISRVAATQIRPSAGTRLPASISTTSPGTSSSASISIAWPPRRTRAMVFIIWASALTLSSALASWRSPITALNTVRPARTTEVPTSPVTTRLISGRRQQDDLHEVPVLAHERLAGPTPASPPVSRLGPCDCSRLARLLDREPLLGLDPELAGDRGCLRPVPVRAGILVASYLLAHGHGHPCLAPVSTRLIVVGPRPAFLICCR